MSTERQKIYSTVTEVLLHQLDVPKDAVHENASLVDDLGADSLAVVELVLALEERFGIDIPDEDAEKVRTVGDVVTYIEQRGSLRDSAAE